jgi:NAD(P)-dependent dehydrogenase (short-subunit alcohol dehydrogenase family)
MDVKKVFVSGATGYIGKLISEHLARNNIDMIIGGKNNSELLKWQEHLQGINSELSIFSVVYDLSNEDSWASAARFVSSNKVDSYINCAGIQGAINPSIELLISEIHTTMQVNLYSSIFFSNYFTRVLSEKNTFRIIHFSGGGSTSARPYFLPYSLSKTGLLRFIENFALENPDIQINAIAPGRLPSRMQEQIRNSNLPNSQLDFRLANVIPDDLEIQKIKILELCNFLLSNHSGGISGKLISAQWDNWEEWPNHLRELKESDLYTLRRITGRDRNLNWGDR